MVLREAVGQLAAVGDREGVQERLNHGRRRRPQRQRGDIGDLGLRLAQAQPLVRGEEEEPLIDGTVLGRRLEQEWARAFPAALSRGVRFERAAPLTP